ncbi:MAG: glycogen debranching protein [Candidatus Eisenbacteria bacterium]|uniref:Glycogen debranching protein n=1 Tax=Eiseniibacteriota bacterium TaxID=2212470 RepID=A0A7Y2H162_UNCEI|nr:glycogen debranching protein [Candidatus Eisenbacteria bacterium]
MSVHPDNQDDPDNRGNPGNLDDQGLKQIASFSPRPFPVWNLEVAEGALERELFLLHGQGDLIVRYQWQGTSSVTLELRPLLAFRYYHDTGALSEAELTVREVRPGMQEFSARDMQFCLEAPGFEHDPKKYPPHRYDTETYRGLDDEETLFSPGFFRMELIPKEDVFLRASLEPRAKSDFAALRKQELRRRDSLKVSVLSRFPGLEPLAQAADQFLVQRSGKNTVIAGYPWFTDWGRDTMIALPGLTLARGRSDLAVELIQTFAAHLKEGLIPNRFPDEGETPEYNTVDATLWFAVAIYQTWLETEDPGFLDEMLPHLEAVYEHHRRGTLHRIHVDKDGLLFAGEPGVQLTWMDAKVDDWVVTPRIGKPVEIQALWFNFLQIMNALSNAQGKPDPKWLEHAHRVQESFNRFWSEADGYFADLIDENNDLDRSLRPNQLFALSLPFPLSNKGQAQSVLSAVRDHLLTPRGLRSLSPNHKDFEPVYGGDRRTRDAAYHQGTVWGWLTGPYMGALLRFGGEEGSREVEALLRDWAEHLREGCLGQGSEVFDATEPFAPRGCSAQAWTVAELIRIAREMASRT